MAEKSPRNGRCPHCRRVLQVLTRGYAVPTMAPHNYRQSPPKNAPKGTRGKIVPCPGAGRACVPGSEK